MPTPIGNFFMKAIIHSPIHAMLGPSFAVITVRGRKTGRKISLPINTIPQKDDSLLVVSMRNRTWWRNLEGGAQAGLRRAGKTTTVRAELITAEEKVAAGLSAYFAEYPGYAKYFDIPMLAECKPDPVRLRKLAGERVLLRLHSVE
jgi:deazaflavin-dependent oxidoreductase (nitroreductase family)